MLQKYRSVDSYLRRWKLALGAIRFYTIRGELHAALSSIVLKGALQ